MFKSKFKKIPQWKVRNLKEIPFIDNRPETIAITTTEHNLARKKDPVKAKLLVEICWNITLTIIKKKNNTNLQTISMKFQLDWHNSQAEFLSYNRQQASQ